MNNNKPNLRFHFKEFIKTDSHLKGIDKIRETPDYICDLFVYEPKNVEEAQLGILFMLGKIENIPKDKYKNSDFLLSLLISVIKREFYSDFRRPTLEALEVSLNKANLYLADFTEKGNVEWIGNLNFICGAFSQNTLHITQVGESIIKLFRKTTVSHIENKFPIRKRTHPLKTFGNIASGTILNGDKIILGTKNILNIAPLANLKELSKRNHHQIIESLKTFAEKRTIKVPIICLVLEAKTEAPEEIIACIPASQRGESASQFDSEEQPVRFVESRRTRRIKIKSAILKTLRISRKIAIIIFLVCRRAGLGIYSFLASIVRKISKIGPFHKLTLPIFLKIKPHAKNLSIRLSPVQGKIKNNYYLLKQNKPAFFIASLLIILILTLPFFVAQKINYHIKINHLEKLSAEIEEIQKKTDAALIYSNKEKAKGLLQKNQILLANLLKYFEKSSLKNNNETLNKTAVLQEKHQKQQDSINNVQRIKDLEEILDFSTSGFIVNPAGINKIKDSLYFYELESGILYKFPAYGWSAEGGNAEKKDLTLIFISAKDELREMVLLKNGLLVLFGQSGKIYLYNSNTNDYNTYSLDLAIAVEKIKDVKSFFSNFYILDIEQGNIIKYPLASIEENSIEGTNWLLEPMKELKQAQGMAIDGSIYVLNFDGVITKYFQGKKVEDIKLLLEKPLAGENELFTGIDFDNLYISDPKNKRLIVLSREGKVINQYVNDAFINLKDFWVTNDEKEVYLLCEKKVYRIEL